MPTLCSKLTYYASIMLDALVCLLCQKLCRHNRRRPNYRLKHSQLRSYIAVYLYKLINNVLECRYTIPHTNTTDIYMHTQTHTSSHTRTINKPSKNQVPENLCMHTSYVTNPLHLVSEVRMQLKFYVRCQVIVWLQLLYVPYSPIDHHYFVLHVYYTDLGHCSAEYEVVIHFYSQIVCCISAKTLSPHFVVENIISSEDHLEISNVPSTVKAAALLLCKISCSLRAGSTEVFYKFLDIIEQYGGIDSKTVTTAIRKKLKSEDKGINYIDNNLHIHSYICMQLYAKQKHPGCKISARPRRRSIVVLKTLISAEAKKKHIQIFSTA